APQPTGTLPPTSVPPTGTPASIGTAAPAATSVATPPRPSPQATSTPQPQVNLDVRLWNGSAEVQIDGRTITPGQLKVDRRPHQLAALVNGDIVSLADAPLDGGRVDLVVPPPLASLAI